MQTVESREIRGVTVKIAVLLISQAIVITATVVATYYSVITQIKLNRQSQGDYQLYNDQRIESAKQEYKIQQTEIKGLQDQVNALMIKYVSDHSSPNPK